ncbi:carbamoyltransferase C-terminal domain-containing protein [Mycolicibacterium boenickei]
MGWHDPSACLVDADGVVHALIEEERIVRDKHAKGHFPTSAAAQCLRIAGITAADIDVLAIGWDLPRHSCRQDLARLDPPVLGRPWLFGDTRDVLARVLGEDLDPRRHPELVFVPHHDAHAYSSFYASGYDSAAVVVADGYGDEESISIYEARAGRRLIRRERWPIPSSLGHMYDAVSEIIGLDYLDAGKTMGLAAHGRARGLEPWPIFEMRPDGFAPPFDLPSGTPDRQIILAWWDHFRGLGFRRRECDSEQLDQFDDAVRLAWSGQASLEQVWLWLANRARQMAGSHNLCLSGGVALNCSANGLVPAPVYVPPVPHDAGVALGAAWSIAPPQPSGHRFVPYQGRTISDTEVDAALELREFQVSTFEPDRIAKRLIDGQIGALVTGRAETGPRALCHRSLLAAPYDPAAQDRLNKAKGRELWRPLSPVGVPECEGVYWESEPNLHLYMVGAAKVPESAQAKIPSAVHVDGTARPQIVADPAEPVRAILDQLQSNGMPPVLINTSFNTRAEPIVDTAEQALASAKAIGLDFLVLNDRVVDF